MRMEDAKYYASRIATHGVQEVMRTLSFGPYYHQSLSIKVVPKERPRTGKNGHIYTPKRTQDCEKEIAKLCNDAKLVFFPIKLRVVIYEKVPVSKKLLYLFIKPSKSDLDNKIKTITDALNGIAYKDDRQISAIDAEIHYTMDEDYVEISLRRHGFSLNEANTIYNLMKGKIG